MEEEYASDMTLAKWARDKTRRQQEKGDGHAGDESWLHISSFPHEHNEATGL
jgi:hypothetical protein